MVREAIGKIAKNPSSNTGMIFIPAKLTLDSAFPFKFPDKIKIRIDCERLIVEKVKP